MRIALFIPLLLSFFLIGCSQEEEMNDVETYIAIKYGAKRADLNFKSKEVKKDGEIVEDRKYLLLELRNPDSIEKILTDDEFAKFYGATVANFLIDSIHFEEMPFRPQEIEMEFTKNKSFLNFSSSNTRIVTYDVD